MDRQPDYRVTLRPLADGFPPAVRLRRFLKAALRAYGLRAVAVEEVPRPGGSVEIPVPTVPGADACTSDPTPAE